MRKLGNKKGQEGFSSLGVIASLVIIGVLVGLVLYWIFYTSRGGEVGLRTIAPNILDSYAQLTCRAALSSNFINTFCEYKEFRDQKTNEKFYANCLYPKVQNALKASDLGDTIMDCSSYSPQDYCKDVSDKTLQIWDNTQKKLVSCKDLPELVAIITPPVTTCIGLGGVWQPADCSIPANKLTPTDLSDKGTNSFCCRKTIA